MDTLQKEIYRKATMPATAPASKYWNLDANTKLEKQNKRKIQDVRDFILTLESFEDLDRN